MESDLGLLGDGKEAAVLGGMEGSAISGPNAGVSGNGAAGPVVVATESLLKAPATQAQAQGLPAKKRRVLPCFLRTGKCWDKSRCVFGTSTVGTDLQKKLIGKCGLCRCGLFPPPPAPSSCL